MGSWGTAIFSDDFACDVRDDYIKQIIKGKTSEEATNLLRRNNSALPAATSQTSKPHLKNSRHAIKNVYQICENRHFFTFACFYHG